LNHILIIKCTYYFSTINTHDLTKRSWLQRIGHVVPAVFISKEGARLVLSRLTKRRNKYKLTNKYKTNFGINENGKDGGCNW